LIVFILVCCSPELVLLLFSIGTIY
jgi:hypothetical protein